MTAPLQVAAIVSEPFGENTFLAWRSGRTDCLVIDPGLEPGKIVDELRRHGLEPAALVCTHGHADHIGGNHALKELWPRCPIVIGRIEAPMLTDPWLNLSAQFGHAVTSPPADRLLDEGEAYEAAGITLEPRHIPGHSPGHLVLVCRDTEPTLVFGGDVLMAGSIGRTDFPGGSFEELAAGIHGKLFTLPDDTIVLPGHGPNTTVGREKKSNPFVGEAAGEF